MKKKTGGFTLLELLLVITVIGILALISVPSYNKSKNRAIEKEAISNLKLMAAAERIYKMENSSYAQCTCTNPTNCAAASGCNTLLKLMLNTTNWQYSASGSPAVTVTATGVTISGCSYTLNSANFDAEPAGSGCP